MAKPPALALARMTIRLLLLATGIVAGFAVVLWSPVLLLLLLGNELPWASLSNVGQAYGGASALLSAVALSGVAVSLVLQARQMRQQLITTDRQSHSELVMLGLKDPTLFEALDPDGVGTDEDLKKVYANQWMVYWLGLWEVNDLPERELRNHLSRMFRSPTSLAWWEDRQRTWIEPRNRRQRNFVMVVSDEWRKAADRDQARRPAVPPNTLSPRPIAKSSASIIGSTLSVAFAGTVTMAHAGLHAIDLRRGQGRRRTDRPSPRPGTPRTLQEPER